MMDELYGPSRLGAELAQRLAREGCLQPLAADSELDVGQYGLFELSDLVSVRCAVNIEPDALQDSAVREQWLKRVLDNEALNGPFSAGRCPYWIVDDGERIGTIAFAVVTTGATAAIEISSIYVRPMYRRQGWASRVLRLFRDAAFETKFELASLHAEWNNQDALRFYCAQGMWVRGWSRAIELYFAKHEPRWHIEQKDRQLRFKIKGRVIAIAHDCGPRLEWRVNKLVSKQLKAALERTAPLQLALLRWPIIRSDELWQEQLDNGGGGNSFEGFALQLREYEQHIEQKGWNLPAEPNPSFSRFSRSLAHAG